MKRRNKSLVNEEKEFYAEQFKALGLAYIPSKTPFLMVRVTMPSSQAQKKLASNAVFVRKGQDWEMPDYVRISVGLPKENRRCLEALKKVLQA